MSIYELRNWAREHGVRVPMDTPKQETVEIIMKSLETQAQGIEKILFSEMPPIDKPNSGGSSVRQTSIFELPNTEGFIFIVQRGHGFLLSKACVTYHVPIRIITDNNLHSGDFVTARIADRTVEEISTVDRTTYQTAKSTRPSKTFRVGEHDVKLGQRVLIKAAQNQDTIEQIAKISKPLSKIHKIALLIDESDDCTDFLLANGVNDVFVTKVDLNIKKKIIIALYALLSAKRAAHQGKNVILFVDTWNKLFLLYNSTAAESETIDMTQVFLGPLTDLKTFFLEPKQIENGGSLTLAAFLRDTKTTPENFVMSEFLNLANLII
jgi:transcription termination factor Rho